MALLRYHLPRREQAVGDSVGAADNVVGKRVDPDPSHGVVRHDGDGELCGVNTDAPHNGEICALRRSEEREEEEEEEREARYHRGGAAQTIVKQNRAHLQARESQEMKAA